MESFKLIESIAKYTIWANETVFSWINDLTVEEYLNDLSLYNKNIKSIVNHLAKDTWGWFHSVINEKLDPPDFDAMNRTEYFDIITEYVNKWVNLLSNKSGETLEDEIDGKKSEFYFEELAFNIFNHFTYHRGQLVLGLRILGKTVAYTDYVPFRFNIDHGIVLK